MSGQIHVPVICLRGGIVPYPTNRPCMSLDRSGFFDEENDKH